MTVDWAASFTPASSDDEEADRKALRVLAQVDRTFILATDGDAVC